MLREIAAELEANLGLIECPLHVIPGPEPAATTTFARERIVLEHDEKTPDQFKAPRVAGQKNPRIRLIRDVAAKLTIYAQAPGAGATHWEHRRRAEHILDLVLVQLQKTVVYARQTGMTIGRGSFIEPADLAASEAIRGAAYQLEFTLERAVIEQNYDSSIAGEGTFSHTVNTVSSTDTVGRGPESA